MSSKRVYQTFTHDLAEAAVLLRTQLGYRSDSEFFRALILYEIEEPRRDRHQNGRYWSAQTASVRDQVDREMLEKLKKRPSANTDKIRLVSNAAMKIETRRLERFLNRLTTRTNSQR